MLKHWSGSIVVLQPEADLTAPTTSEQYRFYEEFDALRKSPKHLILDLVKVRNINHVGMSELSTLLSSYENHRTRIAIIGVRFTGNPYVFGFLQRNFHLYATNDEALESFKGYVPEGV